MLSVKNLVETHYPNFVQRHSRAARILIRFLGFIFYESRLQQFEKEHPHLEGFDFVEAVLKYFDFTLRLRDNERDRIPAIGPVVIVANHPLGSLDGLALLNLVRKVRPDVKVVANQLLSTVIPLQDVLLPVNNMSGNTARTNLRNIRQHLDDHGALIIFPAGEVSRFGPTGVKDGAWNNGFIKIASASQAPILPIYVAGRNSLFFYSLSFLARPLSSAWLVREMFKQNHNTVDARIGRSIPHDIYSARGLKPVQLAKLFRKHLYRIGRNAQAIFQTIETVAPPENRLLLKRELSQCETLGDTPDGKQIILYKQESNDCVMREIGRLRELTFRTVGEGSGQPRDLDRFDRDYFQLILWDPEELEIAGAYRIGEAGKLNSDPGTSGLYTNTLFEFGPAMEPIIQQGLELGRSFVQPKYQDRKSLDYLWCGIGAFIQRFPQYRYLFGGVSVSRIYGEQACSRLLNFYSHYHNGSHLQVRARNPFTPLPTPESEFDGANRCKDFIELKKFLADSDLSIPALYKHYADAVEVDGVSFSAFNIDPNFADCVDSLIVMDLQRLKQRHKKRYLGGARKQPDSTVSASTNGS
ncbi:MAG: putative hemolysin [Halioglobus sp.]|jgi:putative hemolysin